MYKNPKSDKKVNEKLEQELVYSFYDEYVHAWAYGKGWPWTSQSFTRACHASPFYALRSFLRWLTNRVSCLRLSSIPFDTPRSTAMCSLENPLSQKVFLLSETRSLIQVKREMPKMAQLTTQAPSYI
jgi:hypothetical protein